MPVLAALALTAACVDPGGELDEAEVSADDDGKADLAAELKVRVGETSVWVSRALERRDVGGAPSFVLRGRTSRNLVDGMAFIADDLYGDFAIRSPRTFEVAWQVSIARGLVDGVNQFVRLGFVRSSGRPDALATRVIVRPRLESVSGSSRIYLTAELTPVWVDGAVAYRIKGHATAAITGLQATIGGVALSGIRTTDPTHLEVDLLPAHVLAAAGTAGTAGQLVVTAQVGGAASTKQARLGLSVKKLGATTADAYETWPRPTCTDATRACLATIPTGSADLGRCGEYLEVQACVAQGPMVDEAAFTAALAEGRARVNTAAFRADAAALAGADRVEQLVGGAESTIEAQLERLFGRRYPTAAARTAALSAAIEAGIDAIYARPMDVLEPHAPRPGDLAAARQVAADALLAELGRFDFEHSAYARPLVELTRAFRARHVESIRTFRTTAVLESNTFAGNWLDPYVEVTIDPATGAATRVFIEID